MGITSRGSGVWSREVPQLLLYGRRLTSPVLLLVAFARVITKYRPCSETCRSPSQVVSVTSGVAGDRLLGIGIEPFTEGKNLAAHFFQLPALLSLA
jgi:hypothetical protein